MSTFSNINISIGKVVNTVNTIADLRNYKPRSINDGDTVIVSAGAILGDADGGAFVWVEGSTVADDGGNAIRPVFAVGSGRWVKAFGRGDQGIPGPIGPVGPAGPKGDPGNAYPAVVDDLSVAGTVPLSPYQGGVPSKLAVRGLTAFRSDTPGEFRFEMNWSGNNSMSIMNRSNSDAYSAIRYLDYQGRETMAVGYGNPGTVADLPFAGAGYIETSSFINADGSPNNSIPPHPLRLVQTGYMQRRDGTQAQGVYGRVSFEADGSFNFLHLDPRFSFTKPLVTFTDAIGMYNALFYDRDDRTGVEVNTPVLRVRRRNYSKDITYDSPGVVIGKTFEGSPSTGGTPPPQVALDVGGTILCGTETTIDRSQNFTGVAGNGHDFALCTMQPKEEQIRLFRPTVGKVDILLRSGGAVSPELVFMDPDHNSAIPLRLSFDGKQNAFFAGAGDAAGGAGVIAIKNAATVPSASPAGGGVLFVQDGALKFKGSAGTVTTIAPA